MSHTTVLQKKKPEPIASEGHIQLVSRRKQSIDILTLILCMLSVYGVIWAFTGNSLFQPSTYNSYVLQANRWLAGHLDLGQNYSYLEIAEYAGRYFVSFPPIPSVILLPFCLLFGGNPPDTLIAVLISLVGAVYALKTAWLAGQRGKRAILFALLITVGSNFLHIGFSADVWYIAQNCAFAFTMISIYYCLTDSLKTGWLPCFFLALAFGCRPLQIVYLPLIGFLLYRKLKRNGLTIRQAVKSCWWWIIPPLCIGIGLMALNYARFDSVFQFGHDYLPEFAVEKPAGQFSLSYLASNWKLLWQLPKLEEGIVRFPLFNGCAFWIFSPVAVLFAVYFLKGIKRTIKKPEVILSILLILVHFVVLCCHATMGGWQFGNRYTVDVLPVLFFAWMAMVREDDSNLDFISVSCLLWGVGINLVGTVALLNHWLK